MEKEIVVGVVGFGLGYLVGQRMSNHESEIAEHASLIKRVRIDVSGYISKSTCQNRLIYSTEFGGVPYSIYAAMQVGIDPEVFITLYKISDPNNYAIEISRSSWNTVEVFIDGNIVCTMPLVDMNQKLSPGYYTDVLILKG